MLSTVIIIAFYILCFINLSSSSHDSYLSSLSIPRDAILFNTTSSSPTEEQTKGSLLPFKREKGGSYSASLKKSLSRDPRRLVRQRIRNRFRKYKSKVVSHVKDIIHLQTPASLVASEASLNTSYLLERSISPLLVFVNRKSGGQRGNIVLQKFQSLFNHSAGVQICDLSNTKPKDFMHMYNGFPSDHLKILCCGGDGTAQWIMNEMYDAKLLNCSFSILPLGSSLFHRVFKCINMASLMLIFLL